MTGIFNIPTGILYNKEYIKITQNYKIDSNFLNIVKSPPQMAFLTKLHKPEGFSDSNKFALNPMTGDLLPWKWASLNPEDFCIDENNDLWHDCDDKSTFSRVVRNGLVANNFFLENTPPPSPPSSHQTINVGERKNNKHSVSTKGEWYSRKKKFKKKKYKNSKMRKRKYQDKRHKGRTFKKELASVKDPVVVQDTCKYCSSNSNFDNMFSDPQERHSCDFCEKCFDGAHLHGKVCEYCLNFVYRTNFCNDCKKNLGEWDIDWRMKLNIPRELHPSRCKCKECFEYRWSYPCFECGMLSHTAQHCPWMTTDAVEEAFRADQEEYEDHYRRIEDEYDDEREAQIRDDYLFGWD